MAETQNYQNHTRWYPLVHFVLSPILLLNLVWQIVRTYQEPSWDRAEWVLVSVALLLLSVAARLQALQAQNRVIRLEESLRYHQILSPELAAQAERLPTSCKIALRFAPDEELSVLAQKTISGELKTPKEIKLAVQNWRGDYLRV